MPTPESGLYPRNGPRPSSSAAERKVYDALRERLPAGWYAWHSLAVFTKSRDEAEADFVIADPGRGILVLEVKGGRVELRDGLWLQNGEVLKRPPLRQARRTVELLRQRLEEEGARCPPYGVGVAFPDVSLEGGGGPDDVRERLLSDRELAYLDEALPALFERAVPKVARFGRAWLEKLHALWGETWIPSPSLGTAVRIEETERIRLDAQQVATLGMLRAVRRMAVRGGAGTGKTLIALEGARRMAAEGKATLVLCFTDALADWLRDQAPGVEVSTVRRLALKLLEDSGKVIPAPPDRTPAFWNGIVSRLFDEALEAVLASPWEAVIVDEGQDFDADDWELVKLLADRAERFWIFHDPRQGFWRDRRVPEDLTEPTILLEKPYRCHPSIQALADLLAGEAAERNLVEEGIAGGRIRISAVEEEKELRPRVAQEIDSFLREGLAPREIAVISVVGQLRGTIATANRIGPHRVVRANDRKMAKEIVADTFLRFKGLERPAVVVVDERGTSKEAGEARATRFHIAVSRALSAVRIVGMKTLIDDDPVLGSFTAEQPAALRGTTSGDSRIARRDRRSRSRAGRRTGWRNGR